MAVALAVIGGSAPVARADTTSCMTIAGALQCSYPAPGGGAGAMNCFPLVGNTFECTTNDGQAAGCYTLAGGFVQCNWTRP